MQFSAARMKRSRSSLYYCSKSSGLGTSPSGRAAAACIDSEVPPASETHVFFWTVAMLEKPQVYTGRGGIALGLSGPVLVSKSYDRPNLLSTENARELPKCSKSLHFCQISGGAEMSSKIEEKANRGCENSRSFVGFAVRDGRSLVFAGRFLGYLPGIWPLRCSSRRF